MSEQLPNTIRFNKEVGETPLEALARLKQEVPRLQGQRLAYAGRLDPQASGELLILVGEECKNRDHYQGLDKVYKFDVIFGISTDTGDVMGMIESFNEPEFSQKFKPQIEQSVSKFSGITYSQKYPAYSSKTVDGVPLWKLAKDGKIGSVQIPEHKVTIHNLELVESSQINAKDLLTDITNRVTATSGDFRQEAIVKVWQQHLSPLKDLNIPVFALRAKVSSGTYIRQLAIDLGAELGLAAMCWHIERVEVLMDR